MAKQDVYKAHFDKVKLTPGMEEAFQKPSRLMKSMTEFLASHSVDFVMENDKEITVVVRSFRTGNNFRVCTKTSDTVENLKEAFESPLVSPTAARRD